MSNSALVGASKRVPEIVSVIVVLIAGLALVGWATGSVTLTSLRPTLPPMRPNAAAGLILGSASLWLLTGHWLDKVTRTLGVVCALFLYEHALVRPGDLRRLDAAFFTVNGVISLTFFAFVLLDSL